MNLKKQKLLINVSIVNETLITETEGTCTCSALWNSYSSSTFLLQSESTKQV